VLLEINRGPVFPRQPFGPPHAHGRRFRRADALDDRLRVQHRAAA